MITLVIMLTLCTFIGILAGFLAGLLGIGGGIVTVPALLAMFSILEFPVETNMQMAIGTSLAAMLFTAGSSAYAHVKKGIKKEIFYLLAPGVIIGAMLGAFLVIHLSSQLLKGIVGFSEILIGCSFLLSHTIEIKKVQSTYPFLLGLLSLPIGMFSAILGIGGGILTVPILTFFRIPIHQAISTSAAIGFLIALVGAMIFFYLGAESDHLKGEVGVVYLPAFVTIGLTSMFFAPMGAYFAYRLPTLTLKRLFGVVLIVVGSSIIYSLKA